MLPIIAFDQIYSFDRQSFLTSIPVPDGVPAGEFRFLAGELLSRIMLRAGNDGSADEHRALNYLAVRYSAIYALASEQRQQDYSLSAIHAHRSPLARARDILDVIFTYVGRESHAVDRFFTRVDVTDKFPFLASRLSPYFDH
jgi:hypothetical protein